MDLGGIAISGGIAGKGTLISTNLLYSPLLRDIYGNALPRPVYTLGGTPGVAKFEAAWALDKDPVTIYKTEASADEMTFTMIHGASPPKVYGVALIGHNLTDANITTAKFEGGNDINYDTISADLTINAAALTPAYHLLASPQDYDHWRLRIQFTSSLALQIGALFLIGAAPLPFAKNYQWEGDDDVEIGQIYNDGDNGVPRQIALWERVHKVMVFDRISTVQLKALQLAARNGHCILSPDGANGLAHFGVLQLGRPKPMLHNQWTVTARFTEAAR